MQEILSNTDIVRSIFDFIPDFEKRIKICNSIEYFYSENVETQKEYIKLYKEQTTNLLNHMEKSKCVLCDNCSLYSIKRYFMCDICEREKGCIKCGFEFKVNGYNIYCHNECIDFIKNYIFPLLENCENVEYSPYDIEEFLMNFDMKLEFVYCQKCKLLFLSKSKTNKYCDCNDIIFPFSYDIVNMEKNFKKLNKIFNTRRACKGCKVYCGFHYVDHFWCDNCDFTTCLDCSIKHICDGELRFAKKYE